MEAIWITKAEYRVAYQIHVKFSDGLEGLVDFRELLSGPVFSPLKDHDYFAKFRLNTWTLEWPNGADFAPEFLHRKVLEKQLVQ